MNINFYMKIERCGHTSFISHKCIYLYTTRNRSKMAYVVVRNNDKSHFNILVNTDTKGRMFTSSSVLYRCLDNNFDMLENITQRVVQMEANEVIKSVQKIGREENKNLRKAAYQVFDELGWDQDKFDTGFDFINESTYERIPDDLKFQYSDIIEEAFFTMGCRVSFYTFLREHTDGNIKAKSHMSELLKDMLFGIKLEEQLKSFS